MKIKILLADDHPLMRSALRAVIDRQQDLEVVAEACDGKEAVDIAERISPDVVVMDLSMPNLNGLEATKKIKNKCPGIYILVVTVHEDREHLLGLFNAGADGYLIKDSSGDTVIHAIRSIINGETIFPATVKKETVDKINEARNFYNNTQRTAKYILTVDSKIDVSRPIRTPIDNFTKREREILKLIAYGMSNKEIAIELDVSIRNIKNIISNIFLKIGAKSRTEAISIGLANGYIDVKDLKK